MMKADFFHQKRIMTITWDIPNTITSKERKIDVITNRKKYASLVSCQETSTYPKENFSSITIFSQVYDTAIPISKQAVIWDIN